jgi:hypothetical protein
MLKFKESYCDEGRTDHQVHMDWISYIFCWSLMEEHFVYMKAQVMNQIVYAENNTVVEQLQIVRKPIYKYFSRLFL